MTTQTDVIEIGAGCAGKKCYSTEQLAKDVARDVWYARGVSLRVYACPKCAQFHVTKSNAEPAMKPGWRLPAPSREAKARQRRQDRGRRRRR